MIPVVVLITIVVLLIACPDEMKAHTSLFLEWLSHHRIIGPFVLAFALVVATVLLLPGTIVTLGAGVALMKAY